MGYLRSLIDTEYKELKSMSNKFITKDEVEALFAQDEEDRYINLIIPATRELPELNLIGKKPIDLTIDESVRMKQYASKLYEEALKNTLE